MLSISKTPRTEGWDKILGSGDPRFAAGLPFLVPELLEFEAFCDSGRFFPVIFGRAPRGHATARFLEGFLEGSLKEALLRRVLRRRPARVSIDRFLEGFLAVIEGA